MKAIGKVKSSYYQVVNSLVVWAHYKKRKFILREICWTSKVEKHLLGMSVKVRMGLAIRNI